MAKTRWAVDIIESERGWGQKVDETREFDDYDEACRFRDAENAKNAERTAPDIYWYANDPRPIR
jgi:hypothetical protein